MRTIKFRAWNLVRKEMWTDFFVDTDGNICYEVLHDEDDFKTMFWPPKDKNILMQSTGLFDKNGVEIWEGDILAHTSWVQNKANGSPEDDFSDNQVIEGVSLHLNKNPYPIHRDFISNPYRVVEYISSNKFYQATGFFSPFVGGCEPQKYEVIGNIYETPELLNDQT